MTSDQDHSVNDSEFQGPTVIHGEQHIHQYGRSSSTSKPSPPQDPKIRAQAEQEHLRKLLLRAAWIGSAASWSVGGTVAVAQLPEHMGPITWVFWTALAVALVGAPLDILFFRLRLRWEQRERYWLSTKRPTLGYEILVRIFLFLFLLYGSVSSF
ncbi:hypothetical protein H181DRAFT_02008 [Streptomyces sp. WMMB 714]|uniref:hypothetical protein n=1 Tax=Streptomyces sp. WMMB 714 TaxID=1286822 RepID=UPI0005F8944E|nr:hypothetical protein [Streptomyces sp. WMMB 714]SCK25768.1 hypothetical protein H181DRAFT_02008 [Streptomyces sp. WMMB 714]